MLRLRAFEGAFNSPSAIFARRASSSIVGLILWGVGLFLGLSLATWTVTDPSFTHATSEPVQNWMGASGAAIADPIMQIFGLAAPLILVPFCLWGTRLLAGRPTGIGVERIGAGIGALFLAPAFLNAFPVTSSWPLPMGLGGVVGEAWGVLANILGGGIGAVEGAIGGLFGVAAAALIWRAVSPPRVRAPNPDLGFQIRRSVVEDEYGLDETDAFEDDTPRWSAALGMIIHHAGTLSGRLRRMAGRPPRRQRPIAPARAATEPSFAAPPPRPAPAVEDTPLFAPAYDAMDDFDEPLPAPAAPATPAASAAPQPATRRAPAEAAATARRVAPRKAKKTEQPARPRRALPDQPAAPAAADQTTAPARKAASPEPIAYQRPLRGPAAKLQSMIASAVAGGQLDPAAEPIAPLEAPHAEPADVDIPDQLTAPPELSDYDAPGQAIDVPHAEDAFDDEDQWDETAEAVLEPTSADAGDDAEFEEDVDVEDEFEDDTAYEAGEEPMEGAHDDALQEDDAVDDGHSLSDADPNADQDDDGDGDYDDDEFEGDFGDEEEHALAAAGARYAAAAQPPVAAAPRVMPQTAAIQPGRRVIKEAQPSFLQAAEYEFPPLALLAAPPAGAIDDELTEDALEANARVLEGVLEDFGVRGSIIHVRPGPVVTLYELEPAPGIKSSRVIGLADDIARSMSAISARVAVIPGKNAIGIELPNRKRITVFLRELLASQDFERTKAKLPMCLGKTIGGEAVIADLARMPHLLVAGTTGSGKSVSINTMILSLLYWHKPEACRVILIDPKMLELSVYDGIPHLLTPVVTDPKKAVSALKWAVREMEDRYRKMAKLGVRNIDGYNTRLREAERTGEPLSRIVQTGFDKRTGEAIFEEEILSLDAMPYIVVIVDEMADLMMVAGKEIEGAIQRLAQMARAAGLHLIMATQRPSVDVITGTIKANFPTRISFQVTSKIDSRTVLGEMGAEQLLGMGDMLYMAGGGRVQRVHGPFVSDEEVEEIVAHLRLQGTPEYLTEVLELDDEEEEPEQSSATGLDAMAESDDLYDRAVALVLRDRKASTSYVQRRLSIGYNRAATLIERMENEGVVSAANHAGKREILVPAQEDAA